MLLFTNLLIKVTRASLFILSSIACRVLGLFFHFLLFSSCLSLSRLSLQKKKKGKGLGLVGRSWITTYLSMLCKIIPARHT
ncbi:hypothetical protein QBC42DRAFT_258263 [Cladorrhinum samala]|uniref:Uncharacterized protein n=1 Tax=Cladorrhinum samala TaxID=585594 RepID=A0AAV9I5C4_9PEZI|nr:hypothetical protein QBC42DRAFT_258263 [Cladorrhinum samala]